MNSSGMPARPHRTVLVTGASSGIGRETALQLAEQGASVVLLARRARELERAASACARRGARRVHVATADVADRDELGTAWVQAVREVGPIGSVVHAAGVAAYGRFDEIPPEVFDRIHEVNVLGTANVARLALKHFDDHDVIGNLVLFGSVVGRISTPHLSPYVSSKWGVHGLARTLQAEQTPGGHHVSLVEPGGVDTTIYEKAASYLGVQGKPPPPVDDVVKVARATIALLDHPRRERSVGLANGLMSFGFRAVPAVYDRIVGPLMTRLALDDQPVTDHPGNLFETLEEPGSHRPRDEEYA